jgi:2-polyprenyl-3-methyl-5-hydroxy-6-metoxy-1,4-benzoquinol methylase
MRVRYETWYGDEERPPVRFARAVAQISMEKTVRTVCDIGGGANPLLSPEASERAGIERYVLLDVSSEELAKSPPGYEKVTADVARDDLSGLGKFDFVISHAVAEHVDDPDAFHRTIYGLLSQRGRAMHYFPTFYDPVFIANRVLPEALSERVLQRIQQGRDSDGNHGKFPAYYRWCRGPTRRQIERLTGMGYAIDEYVGIFGHGYFGPLPRVQRAGATVAGYLQRHPAPSLTAYAWVVLSKP